MRKRLALASVLLAAIALAVPLASAGHRLAGKQTVSVTLKEYAFISPQLRSPTFGKPSNLKAGPTTFTFKNAGKFPHDFTIAVATAGAPKFSSGMIKPGKSKTMTVNLKPGAYLALCMEFNGFHWASGMVKPFTVGQINQKGKWVP
jgi:uncharacterized cupredoxin-like copper-binding protein